MLSIKQLRYALAVEKTRHFKKAAEYCSVSQSALSSAITDLEKQLGAMIFERDNKRVLVTEFGKTFLKKANHINTDINDLYGLAKKTKMALSEPISIGVIPTVAPFLFPLVLPLLHEKFPLLKLKLIEGQSEVLVQKVKQGDLDTAILAIPYPLDHLLAFEFWQEDFYIIMDANHSLAQFSAVSPDKLKPHEILLLDDGHCLKEHALAACRMTQNITNNLAGTSLITLVAMVAGKMGITLLPKMALPLIKLHPNLIAIALDEQGPHRKLASISRLNYSGLHHLEALNAVFRDALTEESLKEIVA